MCEYCGCRSLTAIDELTREHDLVHGLFPLMAGDFPDQVAVLEAEHRRVDAVLGEAADGTPPDRTWPDRLLATLDMLRDHILKEQDGVFPAALINLSGADWDAVDAVRARVGTLLPSIGA